MKFASIVLSAAMMFTASAQATGDKYFKVVDDLPLTKVAYNDCRAKMHVLALPLEDGLDVLLKDGVQRQPLWPMVCGLVLRDAVKSVKMDYVGEDIKLTMTMTKSTPVVMLLQRIKDPDVVYVVTRLDGRDVTDYTNQRDMLEGMTTSYNSIMGVKFD